MDTKGIKLSVLSGLAWKAMENGGDQLVTFFISIILARMLGPEKYGVMASMLIFIAVAQVIIQNGFQTALIQKKEVDTLDLSSVFWTGLIISGVIYLIIFILSPLIAVFFGDSGITSMLRVLALILFFGSVTSVEIAIAAREMNFRVQCVSTVAADIISGAVGIVAALRGLGTWALVCQQLSKHFFLMLFMYMRLGFTPRAVIRLSRLRTLFGYGWKVLVSGLIDTLYNNLYTPVISRLYNSTMVGYYNRGNQFPLVIVNSMAATVQAVMLPAFSRTQDEKEKSRSMMRRAIKTSSFIMFPALFGIAAVADGVVMLLLGPDWLPAVPLLKLSALSYSVWHIHVVNLQAINAQGRSDIYLALEVAKKIIGILTLILSIPLGIIGMLAVKAGFDFACTFINGAPNSRLMSYGPLRQWKDALPEFILAILMFTLVSFSESAFLGLSGVSLAYLKATGLIALLIVQIAIGVIFYMGAAFILRMESPRYLRDTLTAILRERG